MNKSFSSTSRFGGRSNRIHGGKNNRGGFRGGHRGRGNWFKASTPKTEPICTISEPEVGIRAFLTDHKGLSGGIKQRYSDFIVNEITLDGSVVHLERNADSGKLQRKPQILDIIQQYLGECKEWKLLWWNSLKQKIGKLRNTNDKNAIEYQNKKNYSIGLKQLQDMFDKETLVNFEEYHAQKDIGKVFLLPEMTDKQKRSEVHQVFKTFMNGYYVTDTLATENGGQVRVRHLKMGAEKRKERGVDERNSRKVWPSDRGDYLQFALYKENMDTVSALSRLASIMRIPSKHITFAGTKDKRGLTTQLCAAYHVEKVQLLNTVKKIHRMEVGNLSYETAPLRLGDLKGNRFSLVLRNVQANENEINHLLEQWKCSGFINYFGLQRFGTSSIATHEIGREFLRKNWSSVVDLLLRPRQGDDDEIAQARKAYAVSNNIDEALRLFPPYLNAEVAVLKGLKSFGATNYRQAIDLIPYHLRMMYVHAYQSFIWNSAVSYRLSEMSKTEPLVGDLVILDGVEMTDTIPVDDMDSGIAAENDDEENDEPSKKKQRRDSKNIRVKLLTEEDIASSKYTIYDIVLPLPGFDVVYPENDVKKVYTNIAEKEKIHLESLKNEKFPELFVPGVYRYVLKRTENLSWSIKKYNDVTLPLLINDLDRLENKELPSVPLEGESMTAVCMQFDLPSSCYATMALRELTKESTGLAQQLKLNSSNSSTKLDVFKTRIAPPGSSLSR